LYPIPLNSTITIKYTQSYPTISIKQIIWLYPITSLYSNHNSFIQIY